MLIWKFFAMIEVLGEVMYPLDIKCQILEYLIVQAENPLHFLY